MKIIFNLLFLIIAISATAQEKTTFRNGQLDVVLSPFRLPMATGEVMYEDLDKDGDPDVLRTTLPSGIKVQWIDDDDDMETGDREGDLDNDCVMIDLNKDGIYGGEKDLIVDWSDENGDGQADVQAIVDNGYKDATGKWESHYIWFMDDDQDGVANSLDSCPKTAEGATVDAKGCQLDDDADGVADATNIADLEFLGWGNNAGDTDSWTSTPDVAASFAAVSSCSRSGVTPFAACDAWNRAKPS